MAQRAEIRLRLAGPLRVVRRDGTDLTPRSAKAQGLLALLGATPGYRRSRTWLQDKLWSDRGPEQGAASLRQVLVELRRALGDARDCLVTDAGWVGLDPDRVEVEIDPGPDAFGLAGEPPEFAEGLDVRDAEFEDWIRDQRHAYAERLATPAPAGRATATGVADHAASLPAAHALPGRARGPGRTAVVGLVALLLAVAAVAAWLASRPDVAETADATGVPGAIPSVGVQPFDSLGGTERQDALVIGVTQDIITDLSKFGGLYVVAADTSDKFGGMSLASRAPIPMRYAVSGSFQWLGEEVRVNARVLESESGRLVWAERFDRRADDLLRLQNEIAQRVVDVIGPVSAGQGPLRRAELDRMAQSPTESLQAYDYYLGGVRHYERFTPEENRLAREAFLRATELDPRYAKAFAMAAWTHLAEASAWTGSADDPAAAIAEAEALANRALEADPGEAFSHAAIGAVRLYQRRHDEALAAFRRALDINPNGSDLLAQFGWALTHAGEPEEGLAFLRQAVERNAYHPGWYLWDVGWGHFVARRYQEAADVLERRSPRTIGTSGLLALCYAMLDRRADAAREIDAVLRATPAFSVEFAASRVPLLREEDREHFVRALRAAGVPERAGG